MTTLAADFAAILVDELASVSPQVRSARSSGDRVAAVVSDHAATFCFDEGDVAVHVDVVCSPGSNAIAVDL